MLFGEAAGLLLTALWMFTYYGCARSSKLAPTMPRSSTRFADSDTALILTTFRRPTSTLRISGQRPLLGVHPELGPGARPAAGLLFIRRSDNAAALRLV